MAKTLIKPYELETQRADANFVDLLDNSRILGGDVIAIVTRYPGGHYHLRFQPPPRVNRHSDSVELKEQLRKARLGQLSANLARKADETPKDRRPGWGSLPKARIWSERSKSRFRNVAGTIDEIYSPSVNNLTTLYCVGTLPGSSPEALLAIARYSGYIQNLLCQWLRDHDIYDYFYVWEWQNRGALHLNICFASFNESLLRNMKEAFKERWITILKQVSDICKVDLFAKARGFGSWRNQPKKIQAYANFIHTGVRAYLSAYCCAYGGKKFKISRRGAALGWPCPARWAAWSNSLGRKCKSLTERALFHLSPDRSDDSLIICELISEFLSLEGKSLRSYQDKHGFALNLRFSCSVPFSVICDLIICSSKPLSQESIPPPRSPGMSARDAATAVADFRGPLFLNRNRNLAS